MASMKLGSKPDLFHLDGRTWLCSNGLPSDIIIQVGETSFHLHKFPLLSRSKKLEKLIGDLSEDENHSDDGKKCFLNLNDLPGGAKTFLLVAKFCYGVRAELTAANVVALRCAAEFLQMSEDCGEGNLILQTENFLNDVFSNWADTIKALESSDEVLPRAEDLHIVSRCIDSLAMKACADPSLFSWPVSGPQSPVGTVWNGIRTVSTTDDDWWYDDVSFLKLPLYKRFIMGVGSRGMKPERIAGSVIFYAKKYLPLNGRQQNGARGSAVPVLSDSDQRALIEEIVSLLPDQTGIIPTKFMLRLLRTSMILHAGAATREELEKRVGSQLDQAGLEDLLIPNVGYSVETLYDVDCMRRILDHFMMLDRDPPSDSISGSLAAVAAEEEEEEEEEGRLLAGGAHGLTPMTTVANLIDGYLAEVAPDVSLKLPKFQSLAAIVPDYARPLDDGIYRAIDIYLKAHPWLTDSEKEQLCRLMNCQKLSLEATTHAAQNERLPLRAVVQVLFFEQLRLRTSVAGWFFVSDNLENSQNLSGPGLRPDRPVPEEQVMGVGDMRDRVMELERECSSMKQEIDKLVKNNKGSWSSLCRRLGLRMKSNKKQSPAPAPADGAFPAGKEIRDHEKLGG